MQLIFELNRLMNYSSWKKVGYPNGFKIALVSLRLMNYSSWNKVEYPNRFKIALLSLILLCNGMSF